MKPSTRVETKTTRTRMHVSKHLTTDSTHRRAFWGVGVCAGKRALILQDTLRRNRRAVALPGIPLNHDKPLETVRG